MMMIMTTLLSMRAKRDGRKKGGLQLMPKDGVQPRVEEGQKSKGRTTGEKATSPVGENC
jgi:hypothetical protein